MHSSIGKYTFQLCLILGTFSKCVNLTQSRREAEQVSPGRPVQGEENIAFQQADGSERWTAARRLLPLPGRAVLLPPHPPPPPRRPSRRTSARSLQPVRLRWMAPSGPRGRRGQLSDVRELWEGCCRAIAGTSVFRLTSTSSGFSGRAQRGSGPHHRHVCSLMRTSALYKLPLRPHGGARGVSRHGKQARPGETRTPWPPSEAGAKGQKERARGGRTMVLMACGQRRV